MPAIPTDAPQGIAQCSCRYGIEEVVGTNRNCREFIPRPAGNFYSLAAKMLTTMWNLSLKREDIRILNFAPINYLILTYELHRAVRSEA